MTHRLECTTFIPRPRREVFQFFADAHNLERITPPFLNFRILTPDPILLHAGTRIDYTIGLYGIPMKWKTLLEEFVEGSHFMDTQLSGPYKVWRHRHEFHDVEGGTEMRDTVDYQLPFGPLGRLAHLLFVRTQLRRIFDYRTRVIHETFA